LVGALGADLAMDDIRKNDPGSFQYMGKMLERGKKLDLDEFGYRALEKAWKESGYSNCS
jgi:hypothetical protein